MPTHRPSDATCHVLTFKEGMLSAIAHDLRIRVDRFEIEIDEEARAIEARFEASSLRVECVMKNGVEARGTLRDGQKREIEGNIVRDVLHAHRYPTIEFRSTRVDGEGDQRHIEGRLTLHGVERVVKTTATRRGGRWTAEVPVHQPDFRIKPYSAMLGTLKIQPTVRVSVSIPA